MWRQDKGQTACVAAFVEAVRGGLSAPVGFEELVEVSRATLAVCEAVGDLNHQGTTAPREEK